MSLKIWKIVALSAAILWSNISFGHHLVMVEPVIRAAIPGMPSTAGFFSLTNSSDTDEYLINASSTISEIVEFHNHIMNGDNMRMVKVDQILLPANDSIKFESGGMHLMFINLTNYPKAGSKVDVEFTTSSGRKFQITFSVKSILDEHKH